MLFKRTQMDQLIEPVIAEMAKHLSWTEEEKGAYTEELVQNLKDNDLEELKRK